MHGCEMELVYISTFLNSEPVESYKEIWLQTIWKEEEMNRNNEEEEYRAPVVVASI